MGTRTKLPRRESNEKKKMILLVAILAFGGLAIDAETTPDYGEDYWGGTVSNVGTTPDPWRKLIGTSRREQFDKHVTTNVSLILKVEDLNIMLSDEIKSNSHSLNLPLLCK